MAPDFHITPIIREGRAVDFNVIRTGSSLPFAPAASPESFHNTNDHLADALCSEGSGFGRLHGQLNSAGEAHDHA